jgi:hypothetical protein
MYFLPVFLVSAVPSIETAPAPRSFGPTVQNVRAAVAKSLTHLEQSSAAWRTERKCVSCHQVPFTIWAQSEARARGFAVDAAKSADLADWSFHFCTTNEDKGQKTGGFHLTMVDMVLAQTAVSPKDSTLKAYALFETLFAKRQREDGSWREGNQILVTGGQREADEVDTMWTLLAIREMEKLGDKLPSGTRKGLATERAKGLAFLKNAKPGRRIDWLALRILIAREHGTTEETASFVKQLRGEQNPDGGWGFVRGGPSYPQVTGECLYSLGSLGLGGDDLTVRRAWKYLVATQQNDGTWWALSRKMFNTKPDKANDVTFHWGSGMATIGLLQTLPK